MFKWQGFNYLKILPILICILFFIAYTLLAFVRHSNYQSFGYDLGINDQVVWRYAHLQAPLTTIDPFPTQTKFAEHVELVYALISPFYWIWSSSYMLILLQVAFVTSSAMAVYLLAKKYKLPIFVNISLMIAYLIFYGVQFGLWTDVHSSVFAAAFLMWFIYFVDIKKLKLSFLFFLLTLTAKESTGTALFCVSLVYFFYRREKTLLMYMFLAVIYTVFIFFVFYPHILHTQYLYSNHNGILSNLNPKSLIDSSDKRMTIFYTFASWGFLPLLSPLWLIPIVSHFYKFFVIASDLTGAQGLFGQYRIMLTPILALGSIWTLRRFTFKIQIIAGVWLLVAALFAQYSLHLPLSYLAKSWFWQQPKVVATMNRVITDYLPENASVVSQNNITPHISERDKIYTLYPEKKNFSKSSPCGQIPCNWFRWDGDPQFVIVDISSDWDARHLLTDRPLFLDGLKNLERAKVIIKYKEVGTTILYKVNKNPDQYK